MSSLIGKEGNQSTACNTAGMPHITFYFSAVLFIAFPSSQDHKMIVVKLKTLQNEPDYQFLFKQISTSLLRESI